VVFKEDGEGREADAEYFARVRGMFNDAGVHWQTHAYRAGYGGGTWPHCPVSWRGVSIQLTRSDG